MVELHKLAPANAEAIVRSVAFGKPLPSPVLRQILHRSEGVPLFVEEMTRFVLDSGLLEEHAAAWDSVGEIPADAIPTTMDASLTARIDRLGASRSTAQLAGTIGREFSWALLRAVSQRNDETLQRDLDQLVGSGLAWVTDAAAGTYSFKHALVRDAAYNSLLRSVRQGYHSQIAATLLERFPEQAVHRPDLIADHLTLAGREEAAVPYNEAAGRQALDRGSVHEAADHFRRALTGLGKGPQTPEIMVRKLDLQIQLTPLLMTVYGWGSREVEESCERGLALAGELERPDLSYAPMWGLWSVRFLRGQMVPATAAAESVLQVAQASRDPMIEVTGRHATSYTSLYRGEFDEALKEAEAGLSLFDFPQEKTLATTFGLSSSVCLMASRATSLWMTGQPVQAADQWEGMLDLARSLQHPPTLAAALAFYLHGGGFRYSYIHALDRLRDSADELLALCKDEDFFMWYSVGYTYRAIVSEALGDHEEALALMDEGLELFEQTDSRLTLVLMNVLCADALHRLGEDKRAMEKLSVAETEMRDRDEGLFAPEIWRVRGTILGSGGNGTAAEAAYREAIYRARRQGAVALELRAALDLYDLQRSTGPSHARPGPVGHTSCQVHRRLRPIRAEPGGRHTAVALRLTETFHTPQTGEGAPCPIMATTYRGAPSSGPNCNSSCKTAHVEARVASSFLPLHGPLPPGQATVPALEMAPEPLRNLQRGEINQRLEIDEGRTLRLTTIACDVYVTSVQAEDPSLAAVRDLLARAADVIGRLEDAIVFNGNATNAPPAPPGGFSARPFVQPVIYSVRNEEPNRGLLVRPPIRGAGLPVMATRVTGGTYNLVGQSLMQNIIAAIQALEMQGHYGPFACVLGSALYQGAITPDPSSLVLPSDRIIPFLDGGPLLRASTIPVTPRALSSPLRAHPSISSLPRTYM